MDVRQVHKTSVAADGPSEAALLCTRKMTASVHLRHSAAPRRPAAGGTLARRPWFWPCSLWQHPLPTLSITQSTVNRATPDPPTHAGNRRRGSGAAAAAAWGAACRGRGPGQQGAAGGASRGAGPHRRPRVPGIQGDDGHEGAVQVSLGGGGWVGGGGGRENSVND